MKKANVTVRKATVSHEDIKSILTMGENMFLWSGVKEQGAEYDAHSIATTAQTLINHPDSAIFMAEADGKKVGMVAVTKMPAFYNMTQSIVNEFIWWIEPDYRCSSVIKQLISSVKTWAKNKRTPWLHLHLSNNGHKQYRLRNMIREES